MPLGPTGCMRLNPADTLFIQVHDDLLQGGYDQAMQKHILALAKRDSLNAGKSSVASCS